MADIQVVYDDGDEVPLAKALLDLHWLETSAVANPANGEPGFAVIKSADADPDPDDMASAFNALHAALVAFWNSDAGKSSHRDDLQAWLEWAEERTATYKELLAGKTQKSATVLEGPWASPVRKSYGLGDHLLRRSRVRRA